MRMNDRGRSYVFVQFALATALLTAYFVVAMGNASAASGNCTSPRTISPTYTGDTESGVSQTNQTSWRMGVLAITTRPNADIVVSYKAPNDQNWHDSKPVSSKNASRILLKLGTGDVQFSTEYRASSGSSTCNNPPATTFSPNSETLSSIAPNTTQPAWPSTANTTNPSPAPNSNNGTNGGGGGGGGGY